jgi:hypothetical protein
MTVPPARARRHGMGIGRQKNGVLSLRVPTHSGAAKQGADIDLDARQSLRR